MQTAIHALSTQKPTSSAELTPAQQDEIATLFDRLGGQLGAKMADLYAGVSPAIVQAEWAAGLSGFRRSELERGLAACRTRVFPPTLGEFTNLCRPALDPEIAWMEAASGMAARAEGMRGDWSHPAVFRTALAFVFDLRQRSYKECRKAWTFALQREFSHGWLKDVPEAPQQIAREKPKVRGPNKAEAEKIASILGRPVPVQV